MRRVWLVGLLLCHSLATQSQAGFMRTWQLKETVQAPILAVVAARVVRGRSVRARSVLSMSGRFPLVGLVGKAGVILIFPFILLKSIGDAKVIVE